MGYTNAIRKRPARTTRELGGFFDDLVDTVSGVFGGGTKITIPANGDVGVAKLQIAINRLILALRSRGFSGLLPNEIAIDGVMGIGTWTAASRLAAVENTLSEGDQHAALAFTLGSSTSSLSTLSSNVDVATQVLNQLSDLRGFGKLDITIAQAPTPSGAPSVPGAPLTTASSPFSSFFGSLKLGSTTTMAIVAVGIGALAAMTMKKRGRR